jgi:glutaminyl-peptide cyclotransferase
MTPRQRTPQRRPRRWLAMTAIVAAAIAIVVLARTVDRPSPAPDARQTSRPVTAYGYRIVHTYPHDPDAYTQGLLFRDGYLYESTGLNEHSSLRKVTLETGAVVQQARVADQYFAEGLTDWHDELVQLTWQSHVGFVYGLPAFDRRRTFSYAGEGWGLTQDGVRLIMSDGTPVLRFLDPASLAEIGRQPVTENGTPVELLNELEFVKGLIYANIYQTDDIVIIDPGTGRVTGRIDLGGLTPTNTDRPIDVLNGIAYDAAGDRLFVTGKWWPTLFEIQIVPR